MKKDKHAFLPVAEDMPLWILGDLGAVGVEHCMKDDAHCEVHNYGYYNRRPVSQGEILEIRCESNCIYISYTKAE